MQRPTFAIFKAIASVTLSPLIATILPSLRRPSTKINLSSSVARANTLNFSLTALNFFSSLN